MISAKKKTDGLVLDMNAFHHWLKSARGGDRCCYYSGQLAADIGIIKNPETFQVAAMAMRASNEGRVYLTQCRISDLKFEYIATKCREREST